ncbi:hypothetical protein SRS16CHR_04434 [Variovorax sp. SRS16]|uniref:hypothetical protein n=1 Tax=Variovorax sp. SRS16 TaxID=282217 RepID=UPI0013167A2F|nr:hypothetical protein [Variovorax sp. SRS16]VTU29261.1 hypothetical protein SRS16CHR_04434 [Variovorax sp. SRS16]
MADPDHGPAHTPKPNSDSTANPFDRRPKLAASLAARVIANVDALNQILHAITCANQLVTVARQFRDAANPISPNDLNALFNVLNSEFKRRLRIAEAAVAAMPKAPTTPKAS